MKIISIFFISILLQGCAVSGYQKFYQSYGEVPEGSPVEFLEEGQEPHLISSPAETFENYIYQMRSRNYIPIGNSSFNGAYEDVRRAISQAKRVGAVLVIVTSEHTETVSSTVPLTMPNTTTTFVSGSVYAGGGYGTYSGTQTSYGSQTVPVTVNVRRYDQAAVYFVKSKSRPRYGLQLFSLPQEMRNSLGRNTGALVDVVIEESPAFYANVMRGDVLIAVDGKDVRSAEHATELLAGTPKDAASSTLKVIRAGKEILIDVEF